MVCKKYHICEQAQIQAHHCKFGSVSPTPKMVYTIPAVGTPKECKFTQKSV